MDITRHLGRCSARSGIKGYPDKLKISILVSTVSASNFGRAYILAKALCPHYEVEIVGQIDRSGVWLPCDTGEFVLRTTPARRYPAFVHSAFDIVSHASGDVIYASKLLPSSYGVGLLAGLIRRVPVVLDIDDWELGIRQTCTGSKKRYFPGVRNPDAYSYIALTEHLVGLADEVTTVSDFLAQRFGRGVKVPHGRDVHWLDPDRYDRVALRQQWGFGNERIIVWLGTASPEKGIEDLARAVTLLKRADVKLLLVGGSDRDSFLPAIQQIAGDHLIQIGLRPFSELPLFIALADLIVLPQRNTPATVGQVPAKLFDAMSMARPVISTNISDMPQILDGCGVIVEPGNVEQIAQAMAGLLEDEAWAAELGRRAREKCIREYSLEAMEKTLQAVFNRYAPGRRTSSMDTRVKA